MAVVTKYGTGYKDPSSVKSVDAIYAEASVKAINSSVAIANGDNATSVVNFGKVPSNAIILPGSRLDYGAVTGASMSIGFAGAPAALLAATSIAAAGTTPLTMGPTTMNNQAWQLAGLAADPGGMLDVIGTLTVAATATANVILSLLYARK